MTVSEFERRKEELFPVIRKQGHISYFEGNKDRMHYNQYFEMKPPIGSGTIKSACKNVIGARMKQGGMTWPESGAEGCCRFQHRSVANDSCRVFAPPSGWLHDMCYQLFGSAPPEILCRAGISVTIHVEDLALLAEAHAADVGWARECFPGRQ